MVARKTLVVSQDLFTARTVSTLRKDRHPLVVLIVNPLTINPDRSVGNIVVTYLTTFSSSVALANVRISEESKGFFVPVKPATKEFHQEPIELERQKDENTPSWVSIRKKMIIPGETVRNIRTSVVSALDIDGSNSQFQTFDDGLAFSAGQTAAIIDGMIKETVIMVCKSHLTSFQITECFVVRLVRGGMNHQSS